jgi:hypothetical protein
MIEDGADDNGPAELPHSGRSSLTRELWAPVQLVAEIAKAG